MNPDVGKLRIPPSMSLEQAIAEVRGYIDTKSKTAAAAGTGEYLDGSLTARSSQFEMQAVLIARLSEIAARLGEVEPNSKLGSPGVFLKRIIRKMIGWYSRPVYEFDRAALETLQQVRHDMYGLQQQIAALQQEIARDASAIPTFHGDTVGPGKTHYHTTQQPEALSLLIELFKSIVAVQEFRRILHEENPELVQQLEELLDEAEDESQELKAALIRRLKEQTGLS